MPTCKKKNLLMVVFDQFKYDYARYLKKSKTYLPFFQLCDTNSIPTMTESMHANISTGNYPTIHGIISDSCYQKKPPKKITTFSQMHTQFLSLIDAGRMNLLSKSAYEKGYHVCCVGGKPSAVQLLSEPGTSEIRIWRQRKTGDAYLESQSTSLETQIYNIIDKKKLCHFPDDHLADPSFDSWVYDLTKVVFDSYLKDKDGWLLMVAFSALDYIGHMYGPGSSKALQSVSKLDQLLRNLINLTGNCDPFLLVVGDHGCRVIETAIMLDDEFNPSKLFIYEREKDQFVFKHELFLDPPLLRLIGRIQFDGGLIRIWLNELRGAKKTLEWFSTNLYSYGEPITPYGRRDIPEIIRNSSHDNLGDLFILAKQNVAFFRKGWCPGFWKVLEKKPLKLSSDIPLGEHGSMSIEDRHVPLLLSHEPFELAKPKNIDVFNIIKSVIT